MTKKSILWLTLSFYIGCGLTKAQQKPYAIPERWETASPIINFLFDDIYRRLRTVKAGTTTPINNLSKPQYSSWEIWHNPSINLSAGNVESAIVELDDEKLSRKGATSILYNTMEQNLILGGQQASNINLSIGVDTSPSYPLQIDRIAPQIVIKNSASQYPFSISVPESTDPKAFKIGSVGVQTEFEINTVDNRTYLSRPTCFNKNTGTAKLRYISDDATNYEIDISTSLNISGNLNVSGLTTITTFTASGYGLINGTLSVVNSAYFSTATASGKMVSPIGLFNNVIADTTTLRNDLTTETNNRITADNNIAISTTALRNDLTTETNRATTRENEIAISTGTNYADIQTRMKKIADSNLTMNNYKIIASTISAISIEWQDGTISTTAATGSVGDNLGNHTATMPLDMSGYAINNSSAINFDVSGYITSLQSDRAGIFFETANRLSRIFQSDEKLAIEHNVGGHVIIRATTTASGSLQVGRLTIAPSGGGFFDANNTPIINVSSMTVSTITASGMTVDGNVGIGTTGPGAKLDIRTAITTDIPVAYFVNNQGTDYRSYIYLGANPGTDWKIGKDITNAGNARFGISDHFNNERLTILTNGNVGIGTTNPDKILHVRGTSPVLTIKSSGATDDLWTYYAQNETLRAAVGYRNSNAGLTFHESGSDRMVIKSGNVGIGTANPTRKLFVDGDAGGTTGWYNDSDAELKTNIRPITGALEKVKLLNGKYYEWKPELNRSSGTKIGFIAQDVINVIPEVVSKSGEYYGIAYADLVPLLTEAIKEQQLIIDDLKRRIELLESK